MGLTAQQFYLVGQKARGKWTGNVRVILPKGHETERAGYLADGIRGWNGNGLDC